MERIDFVIDKSKPEGIYDLKTQIFSPHFLTMICGKPGSGKTTLLKFILKNENLLFKKFDFVYILTPSPTEFKSLLLPDSNLTNTLNWDWVNQKIALINSKFPNTYTNTLFIFDDLVAQLKGKCSEESLLTLICNRRVFLFIYIAQS